MDKSQSINWVEINLATIQNNIKTIQKNSGRPMMAVVKANAYGHGAVGIARAASEIGITWFGVARLEEALELRESGIKGQVLVLGYTPPEAVPLALSHQIQLTIYNRKTAQSYAHRCVKDGEKLAVHLKIDSGMGRLGIFPEEGVEFMRWLKSLPGIQVEGVFTHFACADEPDPLTTHKQIERFDRLVQGLQAAKLRPALVHASNSGATLHFPEARYDLLRPGLVMYGLNPTPQIALPDWYRACSGMENASHID